MNTYVLQRQAQNERMTWGTLGGPDGKARCHVLEPGTKGTLAEDGTRHPCIPAGVYRVEWYPSARFGRLMLSLVNVPGRSGILIHSGNLASESLGCLIVGYFGVYSRATGDWQIAGKTSRPALADLEAELAPLIQGGVEIEVRDITRP